MKMCEFLFTPIPLRMPRISAGADRGLAPITPPPPPITPPPMPPGGQGGGGGVGKFLFTPNLIYFVTYDSLQNLRTLRKTPSGRKVTTAEKH